MDRETARSVDRLAYGTQHAHYSYFLFVFLEVYLTVYVEGYLHLLVMNGIRFHILPAWYAWILYTDTPQINDIFLSFTWTDIYIYIHTLRGIVRIGLFSRQLFADVDSPAHRVVDQSINAYTCIYIYTLYKLNILYTPSQTAYVLYRNRANVYCREIHTPPNSVWWKF